MKVGSVGGALGESDNQFYLRRIICDFFLNNYAIDLIFYIMEHLFSTDKHDVTHTLHLDLI